MPAAPRVRARANLDAAGALSKVVERHDFSLRPDLFGFVQREFGPFDVDRFATTQNSVCARFNSEYLAAGAEATDALRQRWGHERNYVLPPFRSNLIDRVLDILERDNAQAVLVLPKWTYQPWWNRIFTSLWHRVHRVEYLPTNALVSNNDDCFFAKQFPFFFDLRNFAAGTSSTPCLLSFLSHRRLGP